MDHDHDNESTAELELPGFRFHPTEEELLEFYLKNILIGKKLHYDIICFLNIYHHDPWELPGLAKIGEREWYFFVPRDRKVGNGGRPNRTTKTGFWKATGSDRRILSFSNPKKVIGLKKTLVFYKGRAPRGSKTDWIMNEYRHPPPPPDTTTNYSILSTNYKEVVLCKIYRKATSLRVLEQRAAINNNNNITTTTCDTATNYRPTDSVSGIGNQQQVLDDVVVGDDLVGLMGTEVEFVNSSHENSSIILSRSSSSSSSSSSTSSTRAFCGGGGSGLGGIMIKGKGNLTELQVPAVAKYDNMDWAQDPLWTQLRSPWLENILSLTPVGFANVLNF